MKGKNGWWERIVRRGECVYLSKRRWKKCGRKAPREGSRGCTNVVVDAKKSINTHKLRVQSLKSLSHTRPAPLFFLYIYTYTHAYYTFRLPKVALNYSALALAHASSTHSYSRVIISACIRYHVFSALFLNLIFQLDTVWLLHFFFFGNSAALAKFFQAPCLARLLGATCCTPSIAENLVPCRRKSDKNGKNRDLCFTYFARNREIIAQKLASTISLYQREADNYSWFTSDFLRSPERFSSGNFK